MPTVSWNCWASTFSRIFENESEARRGVATPLLASSNAWLTCLQTFNQFLGGQDLGKHRGLGNQGGAV